MARENFTAWRLGDTEEKVPRIHPLVTHKLYPVSMGTVVRFIEGSSGILSLLEIESEHCSDPAAVVAGVLFQMRVQVVRNETLSEGTRVRSVLQVVEFDGGRIDSARRREIQNRLRDVLERPRGLRQARPAVVSQSLLTSASRS